ncbi:unnamed protein product [marine sediment metagenome]|uniref:Lipoprotein n=1 Tax=marine sediment metagenome TaxID=412755 RepID=X1QYE2_9ZZZZ
MKRLVCLLLVVSITGAGCAGADPNPIAMYLPGDEKKSCSVLKAEVANIGKGIAIRKSRQSKKEGENILWFVGGCFVIVPWFFMDVKGAERAEIDALQQRKDALLVIAADKDCGF